MGIFDKIKKLKGQYDQNRSDAEDKRFVDNFTKIKHLKREKQVLDAKLKVQKAKTQINKEKGRNKTGLGGGSGLNLFGDATPAGGGFSLFDEPKPHKPAEKKPSKGARGKRTVINVGGQRIIIENITPKEKKKKATKKDPWKEFV